MKIKKVLAVMIVGAALSATATSAFAANTEPKAASNVITSSTPSVTVRADAKKNATEPLATVTPVIEGGIGILSQTLVISENGISASQGTWERTWSQPSNWSYYRFYVKNTTTQTLTVQIQQGGATQTYSLAANSNQTWTQSAAVAGDHKIVVSTSDGSTFTGDVAVRTADAPF